MPGFAVACDTPVSCMVGAKVICAYSMEINIKEIISKIPAANINY